MQVCIRIVGCTHFDWVPSADAECILVSGGRTRQDARPDPVHRKTCGLLRADDRGGSHTPALIGGLVGAALLSAAVVGVLTWRKKVVAQSAGAAWRGVRGGSGAVSDTGAPKPPPGCGDHDRDGPASAAALQQTAAATETEAAAVIARGAAAEAQAGSVAASVVGTARGGEGVGVARTDPAAVGMGHHVGAVADGAPSVPPLAATPTFFGPTRATDTAGAQVASELGPPPSLPPELWSTSDMEELGRLTSGLSVPPS